MQMNGSKDGMGQVVLQHYNIVDGNMVQNCQYFSVNGSTFTVGDITNESAVVDMVYKCTGSTGGLMDGAIAAGNSNAALCAGGTWLPTALQLVTIPAENSRRLK